MDYRLLLLVHVLSGMVWVGGGIALFVTVFIARRSLQPQEVDRLMQDLKWADTWLAIPAPLLVVASGIGLVLLNGAWSLTQAWILLSIGLLVAYQAVALTIGGRLYERIEAARERASLDAPEHAVTMRRWVRLGSVLLAILVVVVALMVFKPGI